MVCSVHHCRFFNGRVDQNPLCRGQATTVNKKKNLQDAAFLFPLLLLGGLVEELDILLGNSFLLKNCGDVLELRALNHHLAQVQLGGCAYQWSD